MSWITPSRWKTPASARTSAPSRPTARATTYRPRIKDDAIASLSRGHATVGDDDRARHERRFVRHEEADEAGDLLRAAQASEESRAHLCPQLGLRIGRAGHGAAEQRRVDRAGANAIDPNVVGGVIDGERSRQLHHGSLGGAV